jgi:hypothetical protein
MNTHLTYILCLSLLLSYSSNAQWIKTAGPPGIRATQFFESNNILYVGTDAQGVYKSLDHGTTWILANTGIENRQVLSLTGDGSFIYAGTGATDTNTDGISILQPGRYLDGLLMAFRINPFTPARRVEIWAKTIGSGVYKSSVRHHRTDANGGTQLIFHFRYVFADDIEWKLQLYFYTGDDGNNWFH